MLHNQYSDQNIYELCSFDLKLKGYQNKPFYIYFFFALFSAECKVRAVQEGVVTYDNAEAYVLALLSAAHI